MLFITSHQHGEGASLGHLFLYDTILCSVNCTEYFYSVPAQQRTIAHNCAQLYNCAPAEVDEDLSGSKPGLHRVLVWIPAKIDDAYKLQHVCQKNSINKSSFLSSSFDIFNMRWKTGHNDIKTFRGSIIFMCGLPGHAGAPYMYGSFQEIEQHFCVVIFTFFMLLLLSQSFRFVPGSLTRPVSLQCGVWWRLSTLN